MELLEFFKTDLWLLLSNMFIISVCIAVISSMFTETIKISIERVFTKRKPHPHVNWFVNFLCVAGLSFCFVLLFDEKEVMYKNYLYIGVIIFISWILSILAYSLIIKLLMIGAKILYVKANDYLVDSKAELVSSTLILKKNEELLNEKLAQKLIKKEIEASNKESV